MQHSSYHPSAKDLSDALDGSRHQNYYMARCPAHDDNQASLSISEKQGKILFRCHAGCEQGAVLDALRGRGLWPERKANGSAGSHKTIVATYDYEDESGEVLFQAVRMAPKSFYQRRPDGKGGWINNLKDVRLIPYRLPDMLEGIALGREIFIVEGEKDADNLAKLGFRATCNAGGAGKWRADHAAFLKDAHAVILPDNDGPGAKHAEKVAASLNGIAASVRILNLPGLQEKGDASDWLASGGTAAQLLAMVDDAPHWKPSKQTAESDDKRETEGGLPHWQVEPWPSPVAGDELLDELVAVFRRYMVLPNHAEEALAAWVLHAWTINSFEISPFLFISSPVKQCGKTTLLIMLNFLTPRSVAASNISAAALFRFVEDQQPTLLIDEADSFARDNEELRNVLNAGHTRTTAHVVRCETVGNQIRTRLFSTWAPKVIAAIRELGGTVMDRSIIIKLRRKKKDEYRERLRLRDADEFIRLRRRALRWSADNLAALEQVDRNDASQFDNRLGDNWHPLTAICDLAGGKWPERIRTAAKGISAASSDENDRGIELLADVRRLFDDEHCERFGAEALVNRLIGLEETPWAEWRSDGRAITSRGVAAMLKNFEVKSVKMRDGRFYLREHFEDAWNAYLSSDAHRGGD